MTIINGYCQIAAAAAAEETESMTYLSSLQDASLSPLLALMRAHGDMPTLSVKYSNMREVVFDQNTNSLSTFVQSSGLAAIVDYPPSLLPSYVIKNL